MIPFLTTRAVETGSDGKRRYTTDVATVSGGQCDVELYVEGELEASNGPVEPHSQDSIIQGLRAHGGEGVLVYLHGYNTSLRRACREAAMVAYRTGFAGRFLLISWPASRWGVTYQQDARRFAQSMPAILNILDDLGRTLGYENVNIIAHSMGSRLVLSEIPASDDGRLFNNLILVAADVDSDLFVDALPLLKQRVRNISLLVSSADRLLMLSRTLNLGERLGQDDDFEAEAVHVVDVSDFDNLGFGGHVYHLESDRVGEVLRRILSNEGERMNEEEEEEEEE